MNKLKNGRLITISLFLSSFLFLYSCLDPEWDFERISDEVLLSPGIAAPLAYGSLDIETMLKEIGTSHIIKKFDDSLLYIAYDRELFTFNANEIINIPNQTFLEFFIESDVALEPEWIGAGIGDTILFEKEQNSEFVFNNNERIDSIHIKTMDLVIDIQSSFRHAGILTLTSESIKLDGEPFQEVVQISDASGNFTYTTTIPLDGNTITLDNSRPDTTVLPLSYDLELINSGNPILPSESCDISMTFVEPEFNSVYGYIGDYNLLIADGRVNIDIFDIDDSEGTIKFADPRFTLYADNSYGVPVEIDLSDVEAYSRLNDITTDVTFDPGVLPFMVNAPDLGQVGQSVESVFEINRENCNIVEVVETEPSDFTYSISAATNPEGPDGVENFVTDTSELRVAFEVTLPIWISAEGWVLEETADFDFEEMFGETSDIIEYFRMTMDATNGLPTAVNMQVFFEDESNTVLDSLFVDDAFLVAPVIDEEDNIQSTEEVSKSVEFDQERLKKIEPAKFMRVRATAYTPGASENEYVKFYSYYAIDFKLKMKADLSINSRDQ